MGEKMEAQVPFVGRRLPWRACPVWNAGEISGEDRGRALREEGDGPGERARAGSERVELACGAGLQRGGERGERLLRKAGRGGAARSRAGERAAWRGAGRGGWRAAAGLRRWRERAR